MKRASENANWLLRAVDTPWLFPCFHDDEIAPARLQRPQLVERPPAAVLVGRRQRIHLQRRERQHRIAVEGRFGAQEARLNRLCSGARVFGDGAIAKLVTLDHKMAVSAALHAIGAQAASGEDERA